MNIADLCLVLILVLVHWVSATSLISRAYNGGHIGLRDARPTAIWRNDTTGNCGIRHRRSVLRVSGRSCADVADNSSTAAMPVQLHDLRQRARAFTLALCGARLLENRPHGVKGL